MYFPLFFLSLLYYKDLNRKENKSELSRMSLDYAIYEQLSAYIKSRKSLQSKIVSTKI